MSLASDFRLAHLKNKNKIIKTKSQVVNLFVFATYLKNKNQLVRAKGIALAYKLSRLKSCREKRLRNNKHGLPYLVTTEKSKTDSQVRIESKNLLKGEGKMDAKWVAQIKANDERGGDIIRIGIDLDAKYDGETGCRVIAENGDDVGYYRPKTEEECMSDIEAVWGRWDTFRWTQKAGGER